MDLERRRKLARSLMKIGVEVRVLPSFVDLLSGKRSHNVLLQPVTPDTLLGRDKVELNTPGIMKAYSVRVVLVTGAGGRSDRSFASSWWTAVQPLS